MIIRVTIINSDEYLWIQKTPFGEYYCSLFDGRKQKLKLIPSCHWMFPSNWYFDTSNKTNSFFGDGLPKNWIYTSVEELQKSKTKYIILNEGRVSQC